MLSTNDDVLLVLPIVVDGSGPLNIRHSELKVWSSSSDEEYQCSSYPKVLIGWD